MYNKSKTRNYFRSISRSKSLKRTFSENLARSLTLNKAKGPNLLTSDFFTSKPEKFCFHVLKSSKSKLNEKLRVTSKQAFEVLSSRKGFKLNLTLHDLLCEWTQKYLHKKKMILFLTGLLKHNLSLFESCEINLLVKVVSKNLIRKSQEASLTESYKQAAFTFFNCLVQGSARVWTGKFVECVCRCFNAKKALELMTGLCAGTMDAVCMMKLVKLSIEKDLVRPVLQILKEMLLGKGKYKGSCDVCRFFLLVLYNASKERENLQIVIEGLKVVEDLKTLKGLELDAGVLNSIKLNLEL